MEVRELLRIAIKHYKLLIALVIIAGIGAAWFISAQPSKYEGSISFSINRITAQETADYQYDGYYGIKAAELFGQTLVSWLETPSILYSVYEHADIEPHISSLNSFTGRFKAKLYSPQNMVVTFTETDKDNAVALSESIRELMVQKADEANRIATGESLFEVTAEPSVVVEKRVDTALAGGIGALAGFLIGIVLLALKYYIQNYASRD